MTTPAARLIGCMALTAAPAVAAQTTEHLPYRNHRLAIAERVGDLLARLTLEEKFWQLFMIPGEPRHR